MRAFSVDAPELIQSLAIIHLIAVTGDNTRVHGSVLPCKGPKSFRSPVSNSSDESDYINGSTLYVDGGMMLYPAFRDGGW